MIPDARHRELIEKEIRITQKLEPEANWTIPQLLKLINASGARKARKEL